MCARAWACGTEQADRLNFALIFHGRVLSKQASCETMVWFNRMVPKDGEGEIMSSIFQVRRLARMLLLGATGLASAGAMLWTPSPALACAPASTQDPYGQDDGSGLGVPLGDDGMPLPTNRRRTKAVRKKGIASDKSKKSDSSAKDKSASKKAGGGDSSGKLKFSQDIAPILVANCTGCHSGDGNGLRRGKLNLSTFASMQTGTPDHKVIQPGKPEESTLVRRIKGEDEPRMPQGAQAALSAAAIAKIERWVKEGATLDTGQRPQEADRLVRGECRPGAQGGSGQDAGERA